jgi:hypothetical protein
VMCIPMAFHHYRILDDQGIQRGRNAKPEGTGLNDTSTCFFYRPLRLTILVWVKSTNTSEYISIFESQGKIYLV